MSDDLLRIGPYPVEREVGRGGMGIVYLARDPNLDRRVAIKVIPEAFAGDAERLARFEREARLLAALHHPNVAGIYGIEAHEGRRVLVLEYVEGETLAERIDRGALPIDEALDVCRQIAAALESAHDQGIVHRDLKPGNVKLTPTGEVKVLDFGLAKGDTASSVSGVALSNSPTMALGATGVGMILGTAAYMSPEQARGRTMDRRTDIWSLGCVLYECLTGRQAFAGETTSDMIARILQGEPEWNALPARTPERVRELLQRMLEKDPRRRLRDAGDVRLELDQIHAALTSSSGTSASSVQAVRVPRPAWVMPALLLVLGAVLGAALYAAVGPRARSDGIPPGTRLSLEIPEHLRLFTEGLENGVPVGLGADGTIVLPLIPDEGPDRDRPVLYVRALDEPAFRPIPGTRDVISTPHVSEDGRSVFFVGRIGESNRRALHRVPIDGSAPPVQIFDLPGELFAEFLPLPGGDFLFMDEDSRLHRVSASGSLEGDPIEVRPDTPFSYLSMLFVGREAALDDHRVLLVSNAFDARGWSRNVMRIDLATGEAKTIIRDGGHARVLPDGDLMFSRGDALLRVPFDGRRGEVTGEPVAVLGGVRTFGGFTPGRFETSERGLIVFAPGGRIAESRGLAIIDRDGQVHRWTDWDKTYNYNFPPHVSADGRFAAMTATNARGIDEIWLSEIETPYLRRIVSQDDSDVGFPMLSHDGTWLAFRRSGADSLTGIYVRRTDGTGIGRLVYGTGNARGGAFSWLPGGRGLLVTRMVGGRGDIDLVRLPQGPEGPAEIVPLVADGQRNQLPRLSPDGRWLAFSSDRSGAFQTYVAPYHDGRLGSAIPVLTGSEPIGWAGPRELAVFDSAVVVKTLTLELDAGVRVLRSQRHFRASDIDLAELSTMPDGRFFGVMQAGEEFRVRRLEIVLGAF